MFWLLHIQHICALRAQHVALRVAREVGDRGERELVRLVLDEHAQRGQLSGGPQRDAEVELCALLLARVDNLALVVFRVDHELGRDF